jgi:hypothetical protein
MEKSASGQEMQQYEPLMDTYQHYPTVGSIFVRRRYKLVEYEIWVEAGSLPKKEGSYSVEYPSGYVDVQKQACFDEAEAILVFGRVGRLAVRSFSGGTVCNGEDIRAVAGNEDLLKGLPGVKTQHLLSPSGWGPTYQIVELISAGIDATEFTEYVEALRYCEALVEAGNSPS